MAEFSKLIITGRGQVLLAKMIAGTGDIQFTKIATSDAVYDPDQLEKLDELTGIRQTSLVSRIERVNEVAIKIEAAFHNTELKEGYYMRTLGLYADDPDEGEILYAVTTETTGNCYMPPYNGVTVSGAQIELITTVGNAENVSLEVDAAAVATIGNIRELRDNLGAVEIRFEETTSAERENIRSQDTLGKIFGKVRKYFEDLKAVAFSGRYSDLSGTPEIGNVDNTSDMDKPVSTAQQQALATQYQQLTGYTDQKIADLIGGAPETLDTLKEVADAIEENESVVTALDAAIGRKADQTDLDDHTGNNTIHVTADDKAELAALRGDVTEINSNIADLKKSVADGKSAIASAITSKGVSTAADAAYSVMVNNIRSITVSLGLNTGVGNRGHFTGLVGNAIYVLGVCQSASPPVVNIGVMLQWQEFARNDNGGFIGRYMLIIAKSTNDGQIRVANITDANGRFIYLYKP